MSAAERVLCDRDLATLIFETVYDLGISETFQHVTKEELSAASRYELFVPETRAQWRKMIPVLRLINRAFNEAGRRFLVRHIVVTPDTIPKDIQFLDGLATGSFAQSVKSLCLKLRFATPVQSSWLVSFLATKSNPWDTQAQGLRDATVLWQNWLENVLKSLPQLKALTLKMRAGNLWPHLERLSKLQTNLIDLSLVLTHPLVGGTSVLSTFNASDAQALRLFSSLKSLRLELPWQELISSSAGRSNGVLDQVRSTGFLQNMQKIVNAASEVKQSELAGWMIGQQGLHLDVLQSNLKSLTLVNIYFTQDALKRILLNNRDSLKYLDLVGVGLIGGSWEHVFDIITAMIPAIRSLSLNTLITCENEAQFMGNLRAYSQLAIGTGDTEMGPLNAEKPGDRTAWTKLVDKVKELRRNGNHVTLRYGWVRSCL